MNNSKLVLPFNKIDKHDIPLVGGKGANLGEMINAGFPIPLGFCLTSEAYRYMIRHNDLEKEIKIIIDDLDVHNNDQLQKSAKKIQNIILKADIPQEIINDVFELYRTLKKDDKNPLVAVRSSATAEDLPDASFAGQQESFLNIKGEANLIQAIRSAWASLFGARAIFYRQTKGFDHFKVALAIPVQLMIQSDVSGIMFSINPISNNKRQIVIEAVWGLGDYAVQGVVTPDTYIVNKTNFSVHSRQMVPQKIKEIYQYPSGVKRALVEKNNINRQKLNDEQIVKLAQIGQKIHEHYYFPQDMEWAMQDGELYIVQARPITTMGQKASTVRKGMIPPSTLDNLKKILTGEPASIGASFGHVVKIEKVSELDKVKEGDILVTSMTAPDFVPGMKRAAGIITDRGGQTSHAAIVSRELGVPAVVGTMTATKTLKNNQIISLNGATGEIYEGKPSDGIIEKAKLVKVKAASEPSLTKTRVYVNLGEPDLAENVAKLNADGVGLLRAEFVIAQMGIHPRKMLEQGKRKEFVAHMVKNLSKFTHAFGDRPVVYRATDFKTNEYKNLKGGEAYEKDEPNPMIGFRGAFRYIHDPAVFDMELEAIKTVREDLGYKNLHLMIPFVRTVDQLAKVKKIVNDAGLRRGPSFHLWMMVEIPSNVILLEDFIKVGIDGVSIGSNDLTMLILGTDRDNETVASIYDERNPAVMWALEKIVKTCKKHEITCSICGQAPSLYSDLTQKLVEWGSTSVSVSPDAIDRTREIVYHAERLLAKKSK
jgi:pyruvate, water dikinase